MKKLLGYSLLLCLIAAAAFANSNLRPRMVFEKYVWAEGVNPKARHLDMLIVKFFDEDLIRVRNGELASLNGSDHSSSSEFLKNHPEIGLELYITTETEAEHTQRIHELEQACGKDLVDMFSFVIFRLPKADENPKALLAEILKAPEVETAYYEPIAYDATCTDLGTPTPDFIPNQYYHDAAPLGTDLEFAQLLFGADVVDGVASTWTGIFEQGMQITHEDVSVADVATSGTPDESTNHGTAVMGILGACDDNNVGVLGYLADQRMRLYQRNSSAYASVADVYNLANLQLVAGEVTNSSWGCYVDPMPEGQSCPCNPDQNGLANPEYIAGVKAEIEIGVAEGIHYFLAAGNGCVDMDDPIFGTIWDWSTDTGSVIVGASEHEVSSDGHDPACFTSFGSRVTSYGWGESIYTCGYGTAHGGSAIDDELYHMAFGGTSGATPIVAGCAGVMNNIWRYNHDGDNLAPSTMRSWLQTNATPCNTDLEIGVMPNLFGILAPDLQPYAGSWDSPLLASDVTGDNLLPDHLPHTPEPTFVDVKWYNASRFAEAPTNNIRVYRDDVSVLSYYPGALGPYSAQQGLDDAIYVRGGRHHLRLQLDNNDAVNESLEDNNYEVQAYVWEPIPLVKNGPQAFTRGPLKNPVGYSHYSCDGFSNGGNLQGYWEAFAVMPESGTADYDIRLYDETPTSTSGFESYLIASSYTSVVDFVGVNNRNNWTADYIGVVNYNDSDEGYAIEGDASLTSISPPEEGQTILLGSSIEAGEILDVAEFAADAGDEIYFHLNMLEGNADLALFFYAPSTDVFRRATAVQTINNSGAGMSESGFFTATETGVHGLVICKNLRSEIDEYANYSIYCGEALGDLVAVTRSGWDAELVARNGGSIGELPEMLAEGQAVFDVGLVNQGSAAFNPGSNVAAYLDGPQVFLSGDFNVTWSQGVEWQLDSRPLGMVKGGRHEVGVALDVFDEIPEEMPDGESNNFLYRQYCWAPYELSSQVPLQRSAAPGSRNANNPESASHPVNQDGYTIFPNEWTVVATCPIDPTDVYNIKGYDYHSTDPSDGFIGYVSSSFPGYGNTGFVMVNGSHLDSYVDFGVNDHRPYPDSIGSDDYVIEACCNISDLQPYVTNGPFVISADGLLHAYTVYLPAGSYPITLSNYSSSNLNFAVFDQAQTFADMCDNILLRAGGGNGEDEYGTLTVEQSGYYGIVAYKQGAEEVGFACQYYLTIGVRKPVPITDLTIRPVELDASDDGYYHFDYLFSDVTQDTDGQPLEVDYYQFCWSFDPYAPFPGDWHCAQMNTESEFLNVTSGTTSHFVRVLAVDQDGRVVAASGDRPLTSMTKEELRQNAGSVQPIPGCILENGQPR